ncbi:molybdopterin-binding protein [Clostridium sp. CX1]|uniref:molybdopterin-binding protein n=1 Tax=Clostridium sp. CX1 TaxID=2978346 RepID=UPI0021C1B34E|nr:molybdopterin-binding protein [Clostridium sp. CX1]MCT8978538.1 molybdopterin-binding protein [Clostridium sp. CX1]
MRLLPVQEAVGMVLGHDMTEIIPGEHKKVAFKKGHIITEEEIPRFLNMGKEHIFIMEFNEGDLHENDAAIRMAKAAAGKGVTFSEPKEGKVSLLSKYPGLLKVNYRALDDINSVDDIMFATLHTNQLVEGNTVIAGTRIIPLVTKEEKIKSIERICSDNYPIVQVLPLQNKKVGIVTTGNEVFYKRIEDKFGPVIRSKFDKLGCTVEKQVFAKDDSEYIAASIKSLIEEGVELITVTGGMSVDPDDVTPLGIKKAGADIVSYGAPTLPGAMFLLSYINDIPVLGLPGCVMYNKITIFDLVIPRLLAGEKVTKNDIVKLGHGGMCLQCKECRYPNCSFGKGGLY